MTEKEYADFLFKMYYKLLIPLITVDNGKERANRYDILKPIAKRCARMNVIEMKTRQIENSGEIGMSLEAVLIEIEKI